MTITQTWIGYARSGKEFEVQQAIRDLGITCHVPRKVEGIRRGKKRWPEPMTTPFLPNYVFLDCTADDYYRLTSVKFLAQTKRMVPETERRLVQRFIDATEADYARRMDAIEAGQRVEEYQPEEVLRIVGGSLGETLGRFKRLVETAHDQYPILEVEVEMFGRPTRTKVDPINARKVG